MLVEVILEILLIVGFEDVEVDLQKVFHDVG